MPEGNGTTDIAKVIKEIDARVERLRGEIGAVEERLRQQRKELEEATKALAELNIESEEDIAALKTQAKAYLEDAQKALAEMDKRLEESDGDGE